jgi:hypothetical protein
MWLLLQCIVGIVFGWWLIWLGEKDLRALGEAAMLVAFGVTVAVSWAADYGLLVGN